MKLNIGSGFVKGSVFGAGSGWVNVDFAQEDGKEEWTDAEYKKFDLCSDPWPMESDSVDCIFASHIFEHIEYAKVLPVAKQCQRVLKVGHPIRIICPDPRKFLLNWSIGNLRYLRDCYGEENCQRWDYDNQKNMAFTDMFFNDHYDHHLCATVDLVMVMLVRAGFSRVTELGYCNTAFPEYYGAYDATIDNRPVMSYYLEAVK